MYMFNYIMLYTQLVSDDPFGIGIISNVQVRMIYLYFCNYP